MMEQHDAGGPAEEGIAIAIPDRGDLALLDLNGTLALDGQMIADVAECPAALRNRLGMHVLTAATHGLIAAAARLDLLLRPARLVGTLRL